MDSAACNYNPDAVVSSGFCLYPTETTDCDGNCIAGYEADCSGVCGGDAVEDECGVCGGLGPQNGYDCDGNCNSNEMILQVNMYDYDWIDATEWYLTSSTGTVVASGPIPYQYSDCNYYCGDLVCGFEDDECYTLSANGSGEWSGSVYVYIPNDEQCNGCTTQYAYLSTSDTEFCTPAACDGTTQYISSGGYGSEDDVVWTLTNILTGEEVISGDINECCGANQYDFACFEDGVYEVTLCDTQEAYNDWYLQLNLSPTDNYQDNIDINITPSTLENTGSYDSSGYGCYSELFSVNVGIGCMDPAGLDYSPYNGYQVEECIYPCDDSSQLIIVDINAYNSWQLDGGQSWEITTASGDVVASGVIEYNNNNTCEPYCGDIYCVPADECLTITTSGGSWDGVVNVSQPDNSSPNCNGCTTFLGSVTSNSSSEICLESPVSACADGEQQIFLNGCTNVTYTMTYDDGTIIDGSYDGCYDNTSICAPEGDYNVCVDFDGNCCSFDFGPYYFYYMDGDLDNDGVVEGPSCQGGSCDGGFLYEIYTYGGDCNSGDRTFTLTDTETNEVAWSITMNGCNSEYNDVCLPYGNYDVCVDPPFTQGGSFEIEWINALGGQEDVLYINGWNNPPNCTDFEVPTPWIEGCTDASAFNYNSNAAEDDGSCCYVGGCTDSIASNYDPLACYDDGSCLGGMGCTDSDACNYDIDASIDNGSCQYPNTGFDCLGVCLDDDQDGICNVDEILGCTDDSATNYN